VPDVYGIQYLRGIAAIAVLCFHVSEQVQGPFAIGAAGVDIFFVISGFIMWVTTAGRPPEPARFMLRRITRIIPLYWIVTILTAIAILLRPHFFYGHILDPENFIRSLFFVPVLHDGALHPVVIQGWTLCYEMMFYLLFAATLFLSERRRFWALVGILVVVAALHPFLPFAYARAFTKSIVLEFACGVVIGQLWMQDVKLPLAPALVLLVGGLISLLTIGLIAANLDRFLSWGIPAALIVAGVVFAERARPWKPLRLPRFLGDASYSIYLWHALVTVVVTGVVLRLGVPAVLQPTVIVTFGLVLSAILYLVVEKPLVRLLHPPRGRSVPHEQKADVAARIVEQRS
jgi:exopolysaccharide production protein ExoZ